MKETIEKITKGVRELYVYVIFVFVYYSELVGVCIQQTKLIKSQFYWGEDQLRKRARKELGKDKHAKVKRKNKLLIK